MKKNGFTFIFIILLIAILGACIYIFMKPKSASVSEVGIKKFGKQQIAINGNYGYEVTIPDGYSIENYNWSKNDNYLGNSVVRDSSNNELLSISYGSNGWVSQENHQKIDGVNFEVTNNPLSCVGGSGVGYPIDVVGPFSDNPNLESSLSVEIIVECGGKDKISQSKATYELINSIKWSPELKNVLSGKTPTIYIPNTRFGER